jgi:hypothetical protein
VAENRFSHNAQYCLARAVQCEELAAKTPWSASREVFLDMAKRWRELAAESEQPSFRPVGEAKSSASHRE